MRDVFNCVVDAISSCSRELDQFGYLERLQNNVETGLSLMRQRAVYSSTGSMKAVVSSLVDEIENESGMVYQKTAG